MKKKIYVCPDCKANHKIHSKDKGRGMALIKCDCGCNSIIMVKSGYYVSSKMERTIRGNLSENELMESYIKAMEEE